MSFFFYNYKDQILIKLFFKLIFLNLLFIQTFFFPSLFLGVLLELVLVSGLSYFKVVNTSTILAKTNSLVVESGIYPLAPYTPTDPEVEEACNLGFSLKAFTEAFKSVMKFLMLLATGRVIHK